MPHAREPRRADVGVSIPDEALPVARASRTALPERDADVLDHVVGIDVQGRLPRAPRGPAIAVPRELVEHMVEKGDGRLRARRAPCRRGSRRPRSASRPVLRSAPRSAGSEVRRCVHAMSASAARTRRFQPACDRDPQAMRKRSMRAVQAFHQDPARRAMLEPARASGTRAKTKFVCVTIRPRPGNAASAVASRDRSALSTAACAASKSPSASKHRRDRLRQPFRLYGWRTLLKFGRPRGIRHRIAPGAPGHPDLRDGAQHQQVSRNSATRGRKLVSRTRN